MHSPIQFSFHSPSYQEPNQSQYQKAKTMSCKLQARFEIVLRDALKKSLCQFVEGEKQFLVEYESFLSKLPEPPDAGSIARSCEPTKCSQYAVTHMHNGNRKAYGKYKQKALDAFSEILTGMMDKPECRLYGTGGVVDKNEGAAVEFGNRIKRFYEILVEFEEEADEAKLWK
jgi:hypothetical protein